MNNVSFMVSSYSYSMTDGRRININNILCFYHTDGVNKTDKRAVHLLLLHSLQTVNRTESIETTPPTW